jgi:type IV pilus assembly protein PilC
VLIPLPLIGSVLWRNMVARWCDAVRLGVQAGLDLPRAINLAGEAVASPTLKADGRELAAALESGQPIDRAANGMMLLPATVPAVIALASQTNDLSTTLATLSDMYQQQAETRLTAIPGLLTPVLVILVGLVIGTVIIGLFLPFVTLISALMR